MKRSVAFSVALAIMAALSFAQAASAFTSNSLVVQVYSDGSVLVTQSLAVGSSSGSVNVPLLSQVLSDVVATDQNGSPLSWTISGSNITIYALGATAITLSYETLDLTNKTGTVWTLAFVTEYDSTVVLPKSSTVSSVSGTPYSLTVQGGSPVATVSPGKWEISYGVPLGSLQTSTTTGGGTTGSSSNSAVTRLFPGS